MQRMTNITEKHRDAFNAIASGRYDNFCLFSCWVNGEPTSAICCVTEEGNGEISIVPMFVAVTEGMKIIDHDGVEPTAKEEKQ